MFLKQKKEKTPTTVKFLSPQMNVYDKKLPVKLSLSSFRFLNGNPTVNRRKSRTFPAHRQINSNETVSKVQKKRNKNDKTPAATKTEK